MEVVAEMLGYEGKCTLTHLDVSSNGLGNHGGKVLYEALRENESCPLMALDVRHSGFDKATERYLCEIAEQRRLLVKTERLQ